MGTMKPRRNRLQTTSAKGILPAIVATLVTLGSGSAFADDTEVFFGRVAAQPNVLFVIDVSGSMDGLDGGTKTRLERVRDGLKELLNTTNNINAGLIKYDSGMAVMQPVAPISENRAGMIADIDTLVPGSGTGTVPAMYEAALYLRGGAPMAHQCVDPIGDNPVCLKSDTGVYSYNSPMTSECQSNHIVVLTDGDPTVSSVEGYRETTPQYYNIPDTLTTEFGLTCVAPAVHAAGTCGAELATFLKDNNSTILPKLNNIVTHTIGFNFSETWLGDVATAGGGGNYEVSSTKALITAFENILEIALEGENTFVAPAVTLDQFTRISHRKDMYLALFKPTGSTRWSGNLKKYEFKGTPPQIRDRNNNAALDPTSNSFKPEAHSFWTPIADGADGADVTSGGAASMLPATRKLYTHLTGNTDDLTNAVNALHENNDLITGAILNVPDAEVDNLLQWARGVDVKDEDEDPTTTIRHHMGDPLHSQPVLVSYGGTQAAPDSLVFVGTNEGYLHAIDTQTGVEEYSFVPEHLLENLDTYYDNESTLSRLYGMDGDLTLWVNDKNNNGAISGTGEHAYLYAGMRRGGKQYYALDVTTKGSPKHLWTIESGSTGFEQLGQTWSKPTLAKIRLDGDVINALIFAGGYDPMQDNTTIRSADTQGNTMFIVNATTGALIWNTTMDTTGSDYSDMVYSIPSDPRVIDVDGDGFSDQIYVGDMGGQVWRFDFDSTATSAPKLLSGGMIASLSGTGSKDNRRFFYPPDVSIIASDDPGADKFLAISIGSGNRAHPLDETVDNRFYMIRQESIFAAPAGYGIKTPATLTAPATYGPMNESDLYDATANNIGSSDVTIAGPAAAALALEEGWLIDLVSNGEKVLAQSITVDNKVIFTTYLPDTGHTDNCTPAAGGGRVYMVNVENATPVETNTSGLRWEELDRPGIPPQPSVIFPPDGGDLIVVVGPESVASPTVNLTQRVYWSEQPDF